MFVCFLWLPLFQASLSRNIECARLPAYSCCHNRCLGSLPLFFLSVIPLESHLARTKRQAECCRSNWPEQKSAFLHGAQKDKAKDERKRKIKKKKKKKTERKEKNKGKEKRNGEREREMERGLTLLKEN